ncbi:hypothetical protein AB6D11_03070 [Vibrio splendidus]
MKIYDLVSEQASVITEENTQSHEKLRRLVEKVHKQSSEELSDDNVVPLLNNRSDGPSGP